MPIVDAFSTDIYNTISLTSAVNALPRRPTMIGEMGIFQPRSVSTTTIMVEQFRGKLALVTSSRRGGPGQPVLGGKRWSESIALVHVQADRQITADDVQNVRAFGSETATEVLSTYTNDRMQEMRDYIDVTEEYHRVGALQGKILDADGSTELVDLFTKFGVTEQTQDFAFTTATTDVRGLCVAVARKIEDAIGAAAYTGIECLCGSTWFDALVTHPTVEATLQYYEAGARDMQRDLRKGFMFGGIMFREYRYTVSGNAFIAATEARAFPVGVPGMYTSVYGPADYNDTVGTMGQPRYANMYETENRKAMNLEVQTNALQLVTFPKALIKLTQS